MSEFDFPLNDASDWLSLERIDHCCDRFEEALLQGDSPRIEDFLRETVRVHESLVLQELLRVELHHCGSQHIKPVTLDEYVARFPAHVELIRRTFEEHHLTRRGGTTHAPNADARRRRLGLRSPIDLELNWPTDGNGSQVRSDVDPSRQGENESENENGDRRDTSGAQSSCRDRPEIESPGDGPSENASRAEALSAADGAAISKKTKISVKPNQLGPDGGELPAMFGHFKLLREVGRGGMGVVYEAEQGGTKRRVALKLIRRDRLEGMSGASFKEALSRFRREALAASGTEHPHWVTVFDVGTIDGQPFYSMQLVEGRSLAEIVADGPLEGRDAAQYLRPVAQALQTAHENKIVHRDLKPHNLLVDQASNRALIADFGLAKLAESDSGGTCTGEVFGSPSYLSPEQAIDSSRVDERSDIYSLGATLYHLVTGRPPFHSPSIAQTIQQVLDGSPVAPRELVPDLEIDLETICLKCMHKDPAERYASAADLADELQRYLEHRPIRARRAGPIRRTWQWSRRNRMVATLAASIALLMAIIGVGSVTATLITMGALASSNESLANERKAKREVTDSLIDYIEVITSDPMMADVRLQPLREELLQDAGTQLDQFLTNVDLEQADRVRIAEVWCMIAQVHLDSGKADKAQHAADRALDISTQSADDSMEMKAIELRSRLMLAQLDWESGRLSEAIEKLNALISVSPRIPLELTSQDLKRRNALESIVDVKWRSLLLAFDVEMARGRVEQAEQHLGKALNNFDIIDNKAEAHHWVQLVSNTHHRLSRLHARRLEFESAISEAERSLECWEPLVGREFALDPSGLAARHGGSWRTDIYRQTLHLAQVYWGAGYFDQAVRLSNRCAEDLEIAVRQHPMSIECQLLLAEATVFALHAEYRGIGLSDPTKAISRIESALDGIETLDPVRRNHRIAIAHLILSISHFAPMVLVAENADSPLSDALELLRDFEHSSNDAELRSMQASISIAIAEKHLENSRYQLAIQELAIAEKILEELMSLTQVYTPIAEQFALCLEMQAVARLAQEPRDSTGVQGYMVTLDKLTEQFPDSHVIRWRNSQLRIRWETRENRYQPNRVDQIESELTVIRECVAKVASLEMKIGLVAQLDRVANLYLVHGDVSRAEVLLQEAEQILIATSESSPFRSDLTIDLANTQYLLGLIAFEQHELLNAGSRFRSSAQNYRLGFGERGESIVPTIQNLGSWMAALYFSIKYADDDLRFKSKDDVAKSAIQVFEIAEARYATDSLVPLLEQILGLCIAMEQKGSNWENCKYLTNKLIDLNLSTNSGSRDDQERLLARRLYLLASYQRFCDMSHKSSNGIMGAKAARELLQLVSDRIR